MLSLGALRYRNVLAADGGPVDRIDVGLLPVRGRSLPIANVCLRPGLTRKTPLALYGAADGTGVDRIPAVARHKAVSEALERWAFHATVLSERAEEFAFDVDPTTCGLAAFPGVFSRQARRNAVLEAVERFSLIGWWEGRLAGRRFETDWPGVSAVAIDGPFGGVTVIAYAKTDWGGYVYGHAAEENLSGACEKAVLELSRHEWLMRAVWLKTVAGRPAVVSNIFERRCFYFASDQGHERFQQRLSGGADGPSTRPEVVCDRELTGQWSEYASVWRFSLRPLSDGYLHGGEDYFFI